MSQIEYKKGDVIGNKYVVYDVLGKGGCGVVYRVFSKEPRGVCALKTFLDKYMADAQTRERFRKEAAIWINLDKHPFIVNAYFVDEISGRLFIGMEYVEPADSGWNTLEDYFKYQKIDFAQGLRWAIQFCYGMEYAYNKGIKAHRDIKPSNIMVTFDKSIKISDFGLAGFIDARDIVSKNIKNVGSLYSHQTMINVGLGTPTHMSPEQFTNAAQCDERSDIYSFGVVLYQLASGGHLPFYTDNADQSWQIMRYMHSDKEIPKLDSKLFSIIVRCMEKQPKDRYQRFQDLRNNLEIILKNATGETFKIPSAIDISIYDLVNKGISFNNMGMYDEAIEYSNKAISINPELAIAWTNLGLSLCNNGQIDDAVKALNNAIKIDPACASAWLNKGLCYDKLERINEAYQYFYKACELDAKLYFAYFNIANCLFKENKFQDAIKYYDQTLSIYPHYSPALSNKGGALIKLGKYREALTFIDESLKINPLSWYALYNKAECHKKLYEYIEAIDALKKSISIKSNPNSINTLGACYFELKEYEKAMECFQKTLESEPDNLDALRTKILCFWSMGQPFDAHMFSRMALMIVPDDPLILFIKASIEDNLGKVPDAIESYTSFLKNASREMGDQVNMAKGRIATLSKK